MVGARRDRAKETREVTRQGTRRLITGSGKRKRRTAASTSSAGRARRATGSSTILGDRENTGRSEKKDDEREEPRKQGIGIGRASLRRSRSSRRSKGHRRGKSSSQNVNKIPVLRNRERCSHSVGCRHGTWMRRFSNPHACVTYLPEDERQERETHSRRTPRVGRKTPKIRGSPQQTRDGTPGGNCA